MELVSGSNPILTRECVEFDFGNPPFDPVEFAKEIVKFMLENNGIGLAANQVGVPYRIFAMRGMPQHFVCFNPKIVGFGEEEVVLEEGCLSYPGLVVKVKRPKNIRVRFTMANGEVRTEVFYGITSRIFQHEMDHLNGVVFYNRAGRYHREQALKKYYKIQKK